jgi:hypothetical protein
MLTGQELSAPTALPHAVEYGRRFAEGSGFVWMVAFSERTKHDSGWIRVGTACDKPVDCDLYFKADAATARELAAALNSVADLIDQQDALLTAMEQTNVGG